MHIKNLAWKLCRYLAGYVFNKCKLFVKWKKGILTFKRCWPQDWNSSSLTMWTVCFPNPPQNGAKGLPQVDVSCWMSNWLSKFEPGYLEGLNVTSTFIREKWSGSTKIKSNKVFGNKYFILKLKGDREKENQNFNLWN